MHWYIVLVSAMINHIHMGCQADLLQMLFQYIGEGQNYIKTLYIIFKKNLSSYSDKVYLYEYIPCVQNILFV